MATSNFCGNGSQRDNELANAGRGRRNNTRVYNSGIDLEREQFPITLNEELHHLHYLEGDVVSLKDGKVVPFNPALGFAGLIAAIGENNKGYTASVFVRGAVCARVSGLSAETRQGAPVYAMPSGHFTLEKGDVCIGELLAVESLERTMGIIGFHLAHDVRLFELGGNRPSRLY